MSFQSDYENDRTPWEEQQTTEAIEELFDLVRHNRQQADRLWLVLLFTIFVFGGLILGISIR